MDRKSKIGKFIDSRIWNHKIRGVKKPLSSKKIMSEIEQWYIGKPLKEKPVLEREIKIYIRKSRIRTRTKWSKLQKKFLEWAEELQLSPDQVEKMYLKELIANRKDVNRLKEILAIINMK